MMSRVSAFAAFLCGALAIAPAASAAPDQAGLASPDSNAMILAQRWTTLSLTPPPITNSVIVNASVDDAWALWTDAARMPEFMGFSAEIEPRPGGLYRVVVVKDGAEPLDRGNDGRVIAIEDRRMLSFTWMTPMGIKALRGNSTVVTLHFTPLDGGRRTQIDLINVGYGVGPDWQKAHEYNVGGWDRVISHYQYALEVAPIDWVQRAQDLKRDGNLPMWREHKRRALRGEPIPPRK